MSFLRARAIGRSIFRSVMERITTRCDAKGNFIALDAATGHPLWHFQNGWGGVRFPDGLRSRGRNTSRSQQVVRCMRLVYRRESQREPYVERRIGNLQPLRLPFGGRLLCGDSEYACAGRATLRVDMVLLIRTYETVVAQQRWIKLDCNDSLKQERDDQNYPHNVVRNGCHLGVGAVNCFRASKSNPGPCACLRSSDGRSFHCWPLRNLAA